MKDARAVAAILENMQRYANRAAVNFVRNASLRGKLFRYAVVGVSVAAVYIASYYLLAKVFALSHWISNLASFGFAIVIQYFLQSRFTFRLKDPAKGTLARFLVTVMLGYLFSVFVTSYLVPFGFLPELLGLLLIIALLPLVNLIIMFLWVFVSGSESSVD